jgi:hypothetical protein
LGAAALLALVLSALALGSMSFGKGLDLTLDLHGNGRRHALGHQIGAEINGEFEQFNIDASHKNTPRAKRCLARHIRYFGMCPDIIVRAIARSA